MCKKDRQLNFLAIGSRWLMFEISVMTTIHFKERCYAHFQVHILFVCVIMIVLHVLMLKTMAVISSGTQ